MAVWLPALGGIVPHAGAVGPAGEQSSAVRGEAVLQLLARLADPAGLVVVLEDLHWADPDTLAVVEYLGDNLAGQRVLCLMTVRSEEPSAALDLVRRQRFRPGSVPLELGRLSVEDVAAMVTACAPGSSGSVLERVRDGAEGVPLLVEELLASPGVPMSFVESVRQRLAQLPAHLRRVLDAAAVLGRHFDWRLLSPMTGLPPAVVSEALRAGVERVLLRVEDGSFRFRHALTRDAVLAELLPPDQSLLAASGLAAVEAAHPDLRDGWRELAADLAERSGDRERAANLFIGMGRDALGAGALATAAQILERAAGLAERGEDRARAVISLVEALALAGRVNEAATAARQALDPPAGAGLNRRDRAELNLLLAQAAVAAGRWEMAAKQLRAALGQVPETSEPDLRARIAVLEAEIALATGDIEVARGRAQEALGEARDASEVRCHALEVLGRVKRLSDLSAARRFFEEALSQAEAGGVVVWRARALHELGTIDMFDHLGTERLDQARVATEQLGAFSIAASIDLQLAAVSISRWMPDAAGAHARSAREFAERFALGEVRNKALLFLAEASALRADADGVEHNLGLAHQPEVAGTPWEGYSWGARGEAALTAGDIPKAIEHFGHATSILAGFSHAEPAAFRALWPLLLASVDDSRKSAALAEARRSGVCAFNLNRGLIGYADAVLIGRAGEPERANTIAEEADRRFVNATTWRVLARVLAAPAAEAGGWGQARAWLDDGIETFDQLGLAGLVAWCRTGLGNGRADRSSRAGITAREADVLALVADGMTNKEIAQRLGVSPRTVEKHVEALLRKTGVRSRTQLAIWASEPSGQPARSAMER
jgi:DNA-binding CsgD family transcriptional regulator/tetratricopeptide (TPR) repeat protein